MWAHRMMAVEDLVRDYRPGSYDPPWSWDDEERDLLARVCVCCDQPGHYQRKLEAWIAEFGIVQPVCLSDGIVQSVALGDDGRVWDGHHRIVAARRLGLSEIPVEVWDDHPAIPASAPVSP